VLQVGRRAQRLGEQGPFVDPQGQLPAAGLEHGAVDPDQVPNVDVQQAIERLVADDVAPGVELDAAGAVGQVEEGRLPVAAAGGQPAGDAVALLGLLAGFEGVVRGVDLLDRRDALELVRVRVDALLAQVVGLGAALLDEVLG
jgi:hypothetical protein